MSPGRIGDVEIDRPDSRALPLVVSIVVNYRGLDQTRVCVASLMAADYRNHSVVVVDNASGGMEVEGLREAFGATVEIVASELNVGYGGGANLGLEWARRKDATYAWVLNNDTEVDPGSVRQLVEAMEREKDYGVLSPQIDAPIGPEAPAGIWYAGGTADLEKVITKHDISISPSSPAVVETDFVTGCAMFLRLRALGQTGFFWEQLFLYWEDVDLCFRMREAGWRLGVVRAARIVHFVHGSVQSKVVRYYYYRNAILVANRHLHLKGAARAFRSLTIRAARRLAASALKHDGPLPLPEARGLVAGMAASLGLRQPKLPPRLS
jgi:GT2 family glycosyltransferase